MTGIPRSSGRFERLLRSGHFVVSCELTPPDSANPAKVLEEAALLAGSCDALNVPDGSGAHCHMSSVAICALLTDKGFSPIMQVSCRDRNRIAIQGDVLGGAALGVHNVLCLTGDDVTVGDQPEAKRVFDLDSIQLLQTIRLMRDRGVFLSGRKLTEPPKLFLGAAFNPFAPPYDWRVLRVAKKIEAGAEFFQSQYCFDVRRLQQFMRQARDLGLHELAYFLIGVGPLRSEIAANYLRTKVPGVFIPDQIVERLHKTPKSQQREEGRQICLEIIEQVVQIEGVAGIHIMAYNQTDLVPSIIEQAAFTSKLRST